MIIVEYVGTSDLPGSIIKWGTMSDIDHVQFVLPDGRRVGAMPGAGVTFGSAPPASATVRRYAVKAPSKVYDLALAQVGKPYDWGGVIDIAFRRVKSRRDWRDPSKWFCSELVAWCFEQAGVPILNTNNYAVIAPRDDELSPLMIPWKC